MIRHLYIKNFTLIDELDIDLHNGFSVITGETGAGKSIVLGAIGLLLGQRADGKSIKQGADKCVIEAHFDLTGYHLEPFFQQNDIEYDASDTIVRRELTAAGKSRAFVNDSPAPLSLLKELGDQMVDIHSQHQNLLVGKQDFQLSVVDIIAGDSSQLDSYREVFVSYKDTARRLDEMREETERNRQNADFLQFQYDELCAAKLTEGEQEELERQSDTMTHAEDIKGALYEADNALDGEQTGIVTQLRSATGALRSISRVFPAADELAQRMDTAYIELKDIAAEVSSELESIDFDPSELDAVNARLDKIYDLQKKYHAESVGELIEQREALRQQIANIENSDDALAALQAQLDTLRAECIKRADVLTALRAKAAKLIEKDMQQKLIPLGMPNVRFGVSITPTEPGHNGQDKVSFLFSANTSTPLQPVSQVASGGEIARVMLALKALQCTMHNGNHKVQSSKFKDQSKDGNHKLQTSNFKDQSKDGNHKLQTSNFKLQTSTPTIIFDEIDTGVSGKIAEKMAEMMQEMGAHDRQVLCITHLPQIAALGAYHYKVYKEESAAGTISHMHQLTAEERVTEIAQMLSGSDVSEAAIANAKQLLRN